MDGFCPNEVPLELTLSLDDPLYPQKVEFWMRGEVGFVFVSQLSKMIADSKYLSCHTQFQ